MAFRLSGGDITIRAAVQGDEAIIGGLIRATSCSLMALGAKPERVRFHYRRQVNFPERIEPGRVYRLILETSAGEIIGYLGIKLASEQYRRVALSYFVADRFKGHGYATRALMLLADYLCNRLGIRRLYLEIADGNLPSLRVAEKAGFQKEGLMRSYKMIAGKWHDYWLLARINETSS
jgi:RimJ/RimL family protein N-acetyltransferase